MAEINAEEEGAIYTRGAEPVYKHRYTVFVPLLRSHVI